MPGCVGDGERWCGESSHGSPASLSFVAGLDADAMEGVVDALARVGKLCCTKCYAAAAALRRGDDAACGGMRAQLAPPLDAAPQLLSQPTLPTVDAELPVLLIALDGKRGAASEAQLRRRHPHLYRVVALDARGGAKGLDAMDAAAQGAKTLVSGGTNSATEIGCSVSHLAQRPRHYAIINIPARGARGVLSAADGGLVFRALCRRRAGGCPFSVPVLLLAPAATTARRAEGSALSRRRARTAASAAPARRQREVTIIATNFL